MTMNALLRRALLGCSLVLPLVLSACGGSDGGGNPYKNHDFGDNDPNRVLAIGDSIVEGGTCEDETKSFPTRVAEITGLAVVNAGVSGESSGRCAGRIGRELDNNKPGFVLILTAHNDAIFDRDFDDVMNNMRSMIQAAKNRKVIPIVATPLPIGAPRVFATGPAEDYAVGIRQLTQEEDVPLVDLQKEFGDDETLQCDGLHPTDAGSAIIAAAFSDKLP